MMPVDFPESNCKFSPPPGLEESQCMTVRAYAGRIAGGTLDGADNAVVAWQPSAEEIELIKAGKPIFISFIGGLLPHYPSMSFQEASHPA